MSELVVIRHAQASFAADDYDQLSDLGHRQSALVGAALKRLEWVPDRVITGTLRRQKQTLASMGFAAPPEEHAGLNEYDFHDLLAVKFNGEVPDLVRHDRKVHFRTLRDVIHEWQDGGLHGVRESWDEFASRVRAAQEFACEGKAKRVLVISSGGPIGQMVASTLQAPVRHMVTLNLQVKNTSITRFFWPRGQGSGKLTLNEFNATPHFGDPQSAEMMTYS